MIDWQVSHVGTNWQAAHEAVDAAFEGSGLLVYGRGPSPDDLTEAFMGIPRRQILSRRTGGGGGGGGGGEVNLAVDVVARLWPLAVAGGAGAIMADVWNVTKKALRTAVERLLRGPARSVTIQTVKDDDRQHDAIFRFVGDDLGELDVAIEELAAIVQRITPDSTPPLDPGAWFEWDSAKQRWEATRLARSRG
jgi:hypothetical protein